MYVSRQECPLHPFKRLFEGSLERINHPRQNACACFHFPKQQGATGHLCACLSCGRRQACGRPTCLRRVGRGRQAHRQAGQDAPVEGAFQLLAASTCKRDPAMFILNVHSSFFPIYCYMAICVTKIQ